MIAPLLNSGGDVYSACLSKNENPNQGSFIIEELTDLVEEAVLKEFEAISERGGVLGARETGYPQPAGRSSSKESSTNQANRRSR